MSDLKARLERKGEEEPRRLLMPERVEKLRLAKQELVGITIDAHLEPAHRLVDATVQQAEESSLRYIALTECVSREVELLNQRKDSAIEFSSDGTMKLGRKQLEWTFPASFVSVWPCKRRALAYHLASVCSFPKLDAIVQRMFSLLTKDCQGIPRRVSAATHHGRPGNVADSAQEVRGKQLTDISRPVDQALQTAFDSPEVRYHLLPLPLSSRADPPPAKKQKVEHWPPPAGPSRPSRNKGKGKSKEIDLPSRCVPETPSKQRICFQYNKERCNHQDADSCSRGLHVCWKAGCHGKHPHTRCNCS